MSGLICSGNVQIAILNADGSNKGFMPIMNTVQLEIAQGDANTKIRESRMIEDYGQARDSVNAPSASTLTIGVDDFDAKVAALVFRGDVTEVTTAAKTDAKADVAFLASDVWFPIVAGGVFDVTDVEVAATGQGGQLYVEGTDYKLDAAAGMIMKPTGSAIADTASVTYSAPERVVDRVTAGTQQTLLISVFGRMRNLATGKDVIVNIPQASVYPTTAVDLLKDDFAVSTFTGPIKSTPGAAPFWTDIQK